MTQKSVLTLNMKQTFLFMMHGNKTNKEINNIFRQI